MEKVIRRLIKSTEYSYSLNIPKEFIDKYNWKAKQKLTVEDKGRGILIVKDWRRK